MRKVKLYKTTEGPFLPYRMGIIVERDINHLKRLTLNPEVDNKILRVTHKNVDRDLRSRFASAYKERYQELMIKEIK